MSAPPAPVPASGGTPARTSRNGLALASVILASLATLTAGDVAAETVPPSAAASLAPLPSDLGPAGGAKHAPRDAARPVGSPRAACLAAARRSEAAHGIPEGLLVAIALAESGLHAFAMNIGGRSHFPSGTEEARRIYRSAMPGQAVMAGCVQVNASVHARHSDWPLDPWRATEWGADLLRTHYEKTGNWTDAVRRWNGGGASGERLACRVKAGLQVTNPGSQALSAARCGGNPRERRKGAALLEIAQADG